MWFYFLCFMAGGLVKNSVIHLYVFVCIRWLTLALAVTSTSVSILTSSRGFTGHQRWYLVGATECQSTCGALAASWQNFRLGRRCLRARMRRTSWRASLRSLACHLSHSLTSASDRGISSALGDFQGTVRSRRVRVDATSCPGDVLVVESIEVRLRLATLPRHSVAARIHCLSSFFPAVSSGIRRSGWHLRRHWTILGYGDESLPAKPFTTRMPSTSCRGHLTLCQKSHHMTKSQQKWMESSHHQFPMQLRTVLVNVLWWFMSRTVCIL